MARLAWALAVLAFGMPAQTITTEELEKYMNDKRVFFLDVREPDEIKKLGSVLFQEVEAKF